MVRTRFAPSPTGYLHIGGVRTALFNWLYARRHGGQFLLRIDDTDQERNVDEALQPILDGFRWLGIDWDEGPEVGGPCGPYYQSQRGPRYQVAVDQLLAAGQAYRDFALPEEIKAERQTAEQAGRSFVYSRRWMAESEEQARAFQAEGRTAVVRLKMPREGDCELSDLVRGDVRFAWAAEQDHVVQRADGSCLYHLATVVDDHDFGITHVIRAVEHLSNTPRQIFIAQALGYELPEYAHLPYVAEPGSSNKLSKRKLNKYLKQPDFKQLYEHGARIADAIHHPATPETFNPVVVDFYREVGYLADALVNYLLLLGWSLDDKTESFTRGEMIRVFDLDRVNRAPASFDPQKLQAFQQRAMNGLSVEDKTTMVLPFLERAELVASPPTEPIRQRVHAVVAAAGDRLKVAGDILDYADFFVADDQLPFDESAVKKRLRKPAGAIPLLTGFRQVLVDVQPFQAAAIEAAMKGYLETQSAQVRDLIHALRVAATGKAVGFGVFETLEILGREACLARIDRVLQLSETWN